MPEKNLTTQIYYNRGGFDLTLRVLIVLLANANVSASFADFKNTVIYILAALVLIKQCVLLFQNRLYFDKMYSKTACFSLVVSLASLNLLYITRVIYGQELDDGTYALLLIVSLLYKSVLVSLKHHRRQLVYANMIKRGGSEDLLLQIQRLVLLVEKINRKKSASSKSYFKFLMIAQSHYQLCRDEACPCKSHSAQIRITYGEHEIAHQTAVYALPGQVVELCKAEVHRIRCETQKLKKADDTFECQLQLIKLQVYLKCDRTLLIDIISLK